MSDAAFAALRAEEFPLTADTIYLNSASTGPLPARTRRVLDDFNRRRAAPHLLPDADLFGVLDESRRLIAGLLNAGTDEIALATSTSFGLNLAALSLPLERGDVVVVSDREFPANVYPWRRLRDRGIEVELAPVTADGWPDEGYLLQRIADPRVRVLAVSLVQFSNGYAVDLARLSAATRATETFLVVDAIQGIGHHPVDVRATPVDVLSCGAQKWLLSPWGAAFAYVRRELLTALPPPMVGWMAYEGTDDFSRLTVYADELRSDGRRFEMITLPYQDFAGMNASLAMLAEFGAERLGAHARACHAPLLDWARRTGVRVTSPTGMHGSAIVCVAPPEPADTHRALREAGVVCSLREGSLRFSPHLFNTVSEMERVVEILERRG